jgi:hypothetical protein
MDTGVGMDCMAGALSALRTSMHNYDVDDETVDSVIRDIWEKLHSEGYTSEVLWEATNNALVTYDILEETAECLRLAVRKSLDLPRGSL